MSKFLMLWCLELIFYFLFLFLIFIFISVWFNFSIILSFFFFYQFFLLYDVHPSARYLNIQKFQFFLLNFIPDTYEDFFCMKITVLINLKIIFEFDFFCFLFLQFFKINRVWWNSLRVSGRLVDNIIVNGRPLPVPSIIV